MVVAIDTRKVRGLKGTEELDAKKQQRDVRPFLSQLLDPFRSRPGFIMLVFMGIAIPFFFPIIANAMLFFLLITYRWYKKGNQYRRLPFRLPAAVDAVDYSDPVPGRKVFRKGGGVFHLGNEAETNEELWVRSSDMLTHMLIFGTTGSGKTETLVSLAYNALAMGSGVFYIDPKAAPKLAVQIYTLARACGREDDFRVLNYSTQGKRSYPHPQRVSNTTNPFAFGSAEALTNLLVSLIPAASGDGAVFSQNAQTLVSALMYAMVEKRDKGETALSIDTVRKYMVLDKYIELAMDNSLTAETRSALKSFLFSVGWQEEHGADLSEQPDSLPEQYQYARAYFSLSLASLADTYGHIYQSPLGEVDMFDVIKNRRILVVMLPALEKAPQELQNLGKIALSAVRNACSVGLGSRLEGSVEDVLGSLPTDSPTPFLTIVDEYAAIPTPGFAEVLTQGRGLGVAAIVASQDFAGIKGADETGAQQIVANTKIKWCMTLEDPKSTWELFRAQAAQASVMRSDGMSTKMTGSEAQYMSFKEKGSTSIQSVDRINIQDLQEQIEGEFHSIFKGGVVRGNVFYADVPLKSGQQLRLAHMLKIGPTEAGTEEQLPQKE